jgi:rhamnogalacturonan endolyase
MCHRDTTPVQAPCALNYWRSSHYGGAYVNVKQGEHWNKVIGPFLIYCNSGGDAQSLWQDARAYAEKATKKWPYDWVAGLDYPRRDQRSAVSGKLVLNDPTAATFNGKVTVGLAHAEYDVDPGRGGPSADLAHITWQTDAKHYQFWSNAGSDGQFSIPNVRPGLYTLYAFADGVLGVFSKTEITIAPGGKPVDLGSLTWTPVRRGKQVWEVGTPDRSVAEFVNGDKWFLPDIQLQYAKSFPSDVNFIIGKSDPSKDWYFIQVPRDETGNARVAAFRGIVGNGRATPFSITFDMPQAPKGKATLRLALLTASTKSIDVSVNDKPAGQVGPLPGGDSTIVRHNFRGVWYDRELSFDASMMKQGTNVLTLTVPAGSINNGVIYDCVRLELDESAQ